MLDPNLKENTNDITQDIDESFANKSPSKESPTID